MNEAIEQNTLIVQLIESLTLSQYIKIQKPYRINWNYKKSRFQKSGGVKTAGAERRRDKPERIPTQSGGSEGWYLWDLWESSSGGRLKIYLCFRRPVSHQGGGSSSVVLTKEEDARATERGRVVFWSLTGWQNGQLVGWVSDWLTDWLASWSNARSSPAPRLPKPYPPSGKPP